MCQSPPSQFAIVSSVFCHNTFFKDMFHYISQKEVHLYTNTHFCDRSFRIFSKKYLRTRQVWICQVHNIILNLFIQEWYHKQILISMPLYLGKIRTQWKVSIKPTKYISNKIVMICDGCGDRHTVKHFDNFWGKITPNFHRYFFYVTPVKFWYRSVPFRMIALLTHSMPLVFF